MKRCATLSPHGSYRIGSRRGFTLTELLAAVLTLAILAALAMLWNHRHVGRAQAVEAVGHLHEIRTAEVAYQATTGTFAGAPDTPAVKSTLEVEVDSPHFDYRVEQPTPDTFLAIATRKPSVGGYRPLVVSMDQAGRITYH